MNQPVGTNVESILLSTAAETLTAGMWKSEEFEA